MNTTQKDFMSSKQKRPDFSERLLAERAGFEPANLCGLHAFQACALSQTTRPLQDQRANYTRYFLACLVIQRALVDPIRNQLNLRWRQFGAALWHLLFCDQFNQQTVRGVPRCDDFHLKTV